VRARSHPCGRPDNVRPDRATGALSTLRISLIAGATLLLCSGCAALDPVLSGLSGLTGSGARVHTVDPNTPFVVVTVGGVPASTPTPQGVAATIPDSTPLPRIDPPTRDPAATPRPAASPSINGVNRGGSAAQQAARPPDALIPTPPGAPVPASP
jgi:hypothetical protein